MQLDIRGKNVKVSEERRQLIEKKLAKLDRHLPNLGAATVELATERNRKGGEGRLVVEVTVRTLANGALLRAEERDNDLATALDRVYEKMQRQITRFKDRLVHHKGQARLSEAAETGAEWEQEDEAEESEAVVKVKKFEVKPMQLDEALEQMELLGHNFFIFHDSETNQFSVTYRRNNGSYGLIQPELA